MAGLSARRRLWRDSTIAIRAAGLAAARLGARLIAADLAELGINVDCLPLADVPVAGADAVIGDRAYGEDARTRSRRIAAAVAEGLADGGVLPVLKHIPGHGRATADSHEKLPVVHADRATLEATDFAAFRPLKNLPLAMTAHVVFTAIDPVHPATTSATMIREVIRGFIGFDGLLMSDDVSMGALSGSIARAHARLARGGLRSWCSIATASSTRCGRWRPRRRSWPARRRGGPMRRWPRASRRAAIDLAGRAARVCRHDDAREWPDERQPKHSKPNCRSAAPTSRR